MIFSPVTTKVFWRSVTLGMRGGFISNQKDNNNQSRHKYSLYTNKHFGIKIYDVTLYIS